MEDGDNLETEGDSGFTGTVTENGVQHPITLHLSFGINSRLDGIGHDANGEFSISGTFSDNDIVFTCRYKSDILSARKYTGARHADMSISGQSMSLNVNSTSTFENECIHYRSSRTLEDRRRDDRRRILRFHQPLASSSHISIFSVQCRRH